MIYEDRTKTEDVLITVDTERDEIVEECSFLIPEDKVEQLEQLRKEVRKAKCDVIDFLFENCLWCRDTDEVE
jgi:hypothetical protein